LATTFSELIFIPSISELVSPNATGTISILTGLNNSGKSAYLKQIIDKPRKLYIGVNRFYSFHHLGVYAENSDEINSSFNNIKNSKHQPFQNFEGAFFNTQSAITRLTNERRKILFDFFTNLFGQSIEVKSENPNNEFSQKYIDVNGDSLSVTSSGTRLFLGIVAALMDERFNLVAIDEPEIGLSPPLQRRLSEIIINVNDREYLFPHKPNIVISTHSHLFLDKITPTNNWVVSKNGKEIEARRCPGFSELHDIQLRLLGNDLSDLFLPHAVIFVEGETDKIYLDAIIRLKLPEMKIVIQDCGGDIAQRLNFWALSLGDMQLSPYRSRTFAVYDKVAQAGLDRLCTRIGLPDQNKIKWSGNGIEYLYPDEMIRDIFRDPNASIIINDDFVSHGDISYKKMELCKTVVARLKENTQIPKELEDKLLAILRKL